ncbi:SDR family NAD(P)-dependent oxidoreductase [Hyphomonas sp.]|uniref:SDR family NAD(P)-dependent oxidoreductase n=2 Tax=Hyphomonas sp. TaxID=87 RepID=UPI0030034DCF
MRDKLYIVFGGSRGMGFEAARVLAADGARLALVSRSRADIDAAAASLSKTCGISASGYVADGGKPGAIEAVIGDIADTMGTPRGLLVTTGLTGRNGTLEDVDDDDWEANFQDVLMGHVRAIRATVPLMIAGGGGTVVTTAAYSARMAKSFLFPYAAMKAAVINLTKNVAKTYGAEGIRANCVCPGAFETLRVSARLSEIEEADGLSRAEARRILMREIFKMPVALDRPGKATEAGDLMAFLLSERAAYLTGAIINIDGGTDF